MEGLYLNKYIENLETKEAIIQILKMRGFLIDKNKDRFFFSDNACYYDVQYLKGLLKKYKIGEIYEKNGYKESSRCCWPPYNFERSYKYKVIKQNSVEINIFDDAKITDAIGMFRDMGRNGSEAGPMHRTWDRFKIELFPPKVSVECLEAYVSYYVKAISACGVMTCFSCDGNHKDGGSVYVLSDYPYSVWHKCIWNMIIKNKFGDIDYIGERYNIMFSNQEEQIKVYETLYEIADFLYTNRIEIRKLKSLCISKIDKKYIKKHSCDEVEAVFIKICQEVLFNSDLIKEGK